MKLLFALLITFLSSANFSLAQFIIPGEGIMDIKTGADPDELEWELGFKGFQTDKASVNPELKLLAESAGVDFDYLLSYKHLMWLPVSDVLFKDGKISLLVLSSYPEYNQMLCEDIGTFEGVNFWHGTDEVKKIYGETETIKSGDKSLLIYPEKGIGTEIYGDEVRAIFIFPPQMK